ncbi:MarR family winged helix-turn-helix transcriptional regulator [Antribacter sp. KLBMP9083]|uniref:MarR family winged helix-turn-helix transcriptional regulator n=1 Tax=Antribacter soli TaxID=2910976 RepID=A0AA41QA10_9MICO|nr:MarR family winged helix-turn-helix transcriptional regulator [Antribacter soli]MCF4119614.1 MarR family winged helix-turn-helix transcriptional regulator [Antribacter soli]
MSTTTPDHPPGTSQATAEDLVAALEQLSRAQREAASRVAQSLDRPRAGVGIARVLHKGGPMPLSEVAARLRVDLSVVSRQVSALVDAGHVVRRVDETDRRVRTLALTDSGHALAEDAGRHLIALVHHIFEAWSPDDFADATRALRRIADTISAATPAGQTPESPLDPKETHR